jgi:hypothetical protein
METSQIILLIAAGIVLLVLVVFLIWKNQRDKKLMNPDAQDVVEELHMDQERKKDKA